MRDTKNSKKQFQPSGRLQKSAYKINSVSLHPNKHAVKETMDTSIMIALKTIKYPGMNLTKEVIHLYNDDTSLKYLKRD